MQICLSYCTLSGLSWLRSWCGSKSLAGLSFFACGTGDGSAHFLMTWDYSSVVYLQQYAKTCTYLIERTFVISLSSGCNLGTVQRYLSTYYTKAGPSLDQYHYNDSLSPSSQKVAVQSRCLSDGATRMLIISSVGHTFTPHSN